MLEATLIVSLYTYCSGVIKNVHVDTSFFNNMSLNKINEFFNFNN